MPTTQQKFLDNITGLPTLWSAIGKKFQVQESGKGLSTNDFTNDLKTKLDNIEATAQVNVLESVKVNGAVQTITDKGVDITVPTDNKDLNNGAGYQTADDVQSALTASGYQANVIETVKVNGTALVPADKAVDITVPTDNKDLNNGAGYQTAADVQSALTASGYQANILEGVKVNGVDLLITDKKVDVTVPTKLSDLDNTDTNFQSGDQVKTTVESYGYQNATQVQSLINTAISSAYIYKGSVDTQVALPTADQKIGDVYNIVAASDYGPAGMNVAWNGTGWDALGSSISIDAMTADEINAICI